MLAVQLNEDAARAADLACFHVAQAYVFERTDRTAKSHHGVQTIFLWLTKDDRRADPALRRFLSQSYDVKSVADYGVGPDAVTTAREAANAVATAARFVTHVGGIIGETD